MDAHQPYTLAPRKVPALDPDFRPPVLARRALREAGQHRPTPAMVEIALEQADGSVFRSATTLLPEDHPNSTANFFHVERWLKFLLWSRGGFRAHVAGPASLVNALARYYKDTATGRFDAEMMGTRIYERPFEIVACTPERLPAPHATTQALGRHWNGCRIGFDLGGSDRKVAAVIDGRPVFSEEVVWSPIGEADPQYHYDGIMDSLRRAASHLPRVDAIGGSAAGVYVNNRVKVASLFRGVPHEAFARRVKGLFLEIRQAWNNVPLEVVNDGEVTALAGSMALGDNAVLGIALGTSTAGGYVTPEGTITSWLNELAFVPVDYNPNAPVDEWSGDRGCGAKYFSQQAVGRLVKPAGIDVPPHTPLPETLHHVQTLMQTGDPRARRIYETIGAYLGYTVAHFADFYEFRHLLILGRVTSGPGGEVILTEARQVIETEFPELAARVALHTPDEKDKRHGQAIAAASLPVVP
ncbi:MAG TPA: ROK family protein [Verrucomicrobiota bacterium]|nr:ROK family protein [Verrucomicrobiota bacterium]HNU51950.1 ROK family protein [Verrucomicrobiota bacterium]